MNEAECTGRDSVGAKERARRDCTALSSLRTAARPPTACPPVQTSERQATSVVWPLMTNETTFRDRGGCARLAAAVHLPLRQHRRRVEGQLIRLHVVFEACDWDALVNEPLSVLDPRRLQERGRRGSGVSVCDRRHESRPPRANGVVTSEEGPSAGEGDTCGTANQPTTLAGRGLRCAGCASPAVALSDGVGWLNRSSERMHRTRLRVGLEPLLRIPTDGVPVAPPPVEVLRAPQEPLWVLLGVLDLQEKWRRQANKAHRARIRLKEVRGFRRRHCGCNSADNTSSNA